MYMIPHPSIPTFHETNEDGNKAGKSRQDTQKQELTPNYLHLCTRKKGATMRGQHRERQEQLRQTGKEKKKNITCRSVMKYALFIKSQSKGQSVFLSTRARIRGSPRRMPCLQSCLLMGKFRANPESSTCARSDLGRDKASLRQSPL